MVVVGDLILDTNVIFQMMQKSKETGQQELIAKRERLMVQLEKLGRRIEEFPHCSELDMMQQVQFHLHLIIKLNPAASYLLVSKP